MDGGNVAAEYSDFELTLSGSGSPSVFAYGVAGRPALSPWPAGGTWKFGSGITTDITRDPATIDELQMNYSVTETQLIVSFSFSGEGYNARVGSSAGSWVFTFAKK
jgi:hypothetical protein